MKLLIAYGSLGKLFHLEEFSHALEKQNVQVKLVKDMDFSKGFPSKKISDWFSGDKKFKELIMEFKPDAIFADRQSHFALHAIRSEVPTFILLRGNYWQEYFWGMKTLGSNLKTRTLIWFRNRIAEKVFAKATAVLPICKYLEGVVKEHYPNQNTGVFLEGINSTRWYHTEKMELQHPCVGLVQDANWWGKTKELLILEQVLEKMPNVFFYWAGDGPYRDDVLPILEKFDNFEWLGALEYPDKVRDFLTEIDVYALLSGIDMAPVTLLEAQLMEKPIIATDVGGIPELMREQETGFLVKKGDSQNLLEKISLLLNDKNKSVRFGRAGRNFVENNFNWKKIAKEFTKIVSRNL